MDPNNIELDSIRTLIPLARDGDRCAQGQIFEQVQDVLTNMARHSFKNDIQQRQNPSDVVQLTMAQMLNGFEDFKGTTQAEFFAWLKTILRNEIHKVRRFQNQAKRDISRERKSSEGDESYVFEHGIDPDLTPGSRAINDEKITLLRNAMSKLPDDSAQVIQLRNLDELPFQEIADKMNRSYAAVTKLWQRSIALLGKELAKLEVD